MAVDFCNSQWIGRASWGPPSGQVDGARHRLRAVVCNDDGTPDVLWVSDGTTRIEHEPGVDGMIGP